MIVKENLEDYRADRPVVENYLLLCNRCLVSNEDTRLCASYGVFFKMGWEYDQDWEDPSSTVGYKDGYYQIKLKMYTEQEAQAASVFDVERLYYNQFRVTMERFKFWLGFDVSFWHTTARICSHFYFFRDDFLIPIEMNMRFQECYKNIIGCLWDMDAWVGSNAKWIDQCRESSDEDIDIYAFENFGNLNI